MDDAGTRFYPDRHLWWPICNNRSAPPLARSEHFLSIIFKDAVIKAVAECQRHLGAHREFQGSRIPRIPGTRCSIQPEFRGHNANPAQPSQTPCQARGDDWGLSAAPRQPGAGTSPCPPEAASCPCPTLPKPVTVRGHGHRASASQQLGRRRQCRAQNRPTPRDASKLSKLAPLFPLAARKNFSPS
jgi:hypothetical protein